MCIRDRDYGKAAEALQGEIIERHRPLLSAAGVDLAWFKGNADLLALHRALRDSGILDVDPEAKTTLKKLLNRTGLALKHQADQHGAPEDYANALRYCQKAIEVDPSYGAAHYNEACIMLKLGRTGPALASLATAIQDSSFDFKKQAREKDVDWNVLRLDNASFRQLVGLSVTSTESR